MKDVWIRSAVLVLAAEPDGISQAAEGGGGAVAAMFSVLGLSFLCAFALVALIMAKDRT